MTLTLKTSLQEEECTISTLKDKQWDIKANQGRHKLQKEKNGTCTTHWCPFDFCVFTYINFQHHKKSRIMTTRLGDHDHNVNCCCPHFGNPDPLGIRLE